MIRVPDHVPSVDARRARDELSASWEHLVAAAEHEAKQVARASRRRGALARGRAAAVRRAARGELPESPWRLLGVGLAAGVVIGAVGAAVVLNRRGRTAEQSEGSDSEQTTVSAVRQRAASTVAGVREQASTAAHGATSAAKGAAAAARDKVGKAREKIGGDDDPEAGPPAASPAGPAS